MLKKYLNFFSYPSTKRYFQFLIFHGAGCPNKIKKKMKNFYSHTIKKISKNFKAQPGTANKKIEKKCIVIQKTESLKIHLYIYLKKHSLPYTFLHSRIAFFYTQLTFVFHFQEDFYIVCQHIDVFCFFFFRKISISFMSIF